MIIIKIIIFYQYKYLDHWIIIFYLIIYILVKYYFLDSILDKNNKKGHRNIFSIFVQELFLSYRVCRPIQFYHIGNNTFYFISCSSNNSLSFHPRNTRPIPNDSESFSLQLSFALFQLRVTVQGNYFRVITYSGKC